MMSFSLENGIPTISLNITIAKALYFIVKVIFSTNIEIVLEDRYKNKINEIIEILFISLILAISVSVVAGTLDFSNRDYAYIILFIYCASFVVLLLGLLFNQFFRKIKNKDRVLTFYKVNLIIKFLSIPCINAVLFMDNGGNLEFNEKVRGIIVFTLIYMVIFFFSQLCFNQVNKSKNDYEIRIIDENLNETLKELILLYSLNKEIIIMKEKVDKNKKINDLEVFYVYHFNKGFIFKYRKV